MNNSDRRVKRTKRLLKESLSKLLQTKELHNISVKELTDLADVSRGAFYTHYQDIYDLYDQMESDLFKEINNIIIKEPTHKYNEVYKTLINYIYDNANICRIFMIRNSPGTFRNKMTNFFEEKFHSIVLYEMDMPEMKEEWKFISRYQNEGFISVLSLWLETDLIYPKEKLLRLLIDIDSVCDPLYT